MMADPPFVREGKISMLAPPVIDFAVRPLKALNIMNVSQMI